jgi:fatty-acyl-CoA synthase
MLPERRTVDALLAHLAQTPAGSVVFPPQRLTYAALYAQATAVVSGLWQLGIRPGKPVALLVSNRPEWITTAFGCALIGAPVVAISTVRASPHFTEGVAAFLQKRPPQYP